MAGSDITLAYLREGMGRGMELIVVIDGEEHRHNLTDNATWSFFDRISNYLWRQSNEAETGRETANRNRGSGSA